MIKALPVATGHPERFVQHIIDVTPMPGAENPGGLGRQIQKAWTIIPAYLDNSRQAATPCSRKTSSNRASIPRPKAPSAAMLFAGERHREVTHVAPALARDHRTERLSLVAEIQIRPGVFEIPVAPVFRRANGLLRRLQTRKNAKHDTP